MYHNQVNVGLNPTPTAHITVNRNRQKLFGNNLYLRSGSTFEIELYNPKQKRVLTKIRVNGIYVSGGGIVVNPGQRVYLERFIDVDRKFHFSTYEVDNNPNTVEAIQKNGLIQVDFYDEQEPYQWNHYYGSGTITWGGTTNPFNIQNTCTAKNSNHFDDGHTNMTLTGGVGASSFSCNASNDSIGNVSNYMNQATMDFMDMADESPVMNMSRSMRSKSVKKESLETGRIEQGGRSDQKFTTVYGDFNSWTCASYEYKILPESVKPIEAGKTKVCPNCGAKCKSHWKSCPICTHVF